jgi:hypothetical protein
MSNRNPPQKLKPAAAVLCFGMAAFFFYIAVYEYHYFAEWERVGGRMRINAIAALIYALAGKTGVAAVGVAGGLFMLFGGFVVIYKLIRK